MIRGYAFFRIAFFSCLIASSVAYSEILLKVTGDDVNLRAVADGESEVISQVSRGTILHADEMGAGEWVEVSVPAGTYVWTYAELINKDIVAVSKLSVRSGPGINYRTVGMLFKGDKVVLHGTEKSWMKIDAPASCRVWVNSKYVELTDSVPTPVESVVNPVVAPPVIEPVAEPPIVIASKPVDDPVVQPFIELPVIEISKPVVASIVVEPPITVVNTPVLQPIAEPTVVVVEPVVEPIVEVPIVAIKPVVMPITKPFIEQPVLVISKPVVKPVVEPPVDVPELEPLALSKPEAIAPVVVITPVIVIAPVQPIAEPVKPIVEEVVVVQPIIEIVEVVIEPPPVVEVVEVVIEPPPVIEIVEVVKPVVAVEPVVETVFIPAGKLSRPIVATSSRGEKVDDLVRELGDMPVAVPEPVAAPVSEVVAMPEIVLLPTFNSSKTDVVEPVAITQPVPVTAKPVKATYKSYRYSGVKPVKAPRRKVKQYHSVDTNNIPQSIDVSRLVSSMEQGKMVVLNGKLKRAGRTWRRPSEYRLVGAGRRSASCYVVCENVDLDDLLGTTVTVSGKSYWVQGVRDMVVWVTDIRKSSSAPVLFR